VSDLAAPITTTRSEEAKSLTTQPEALHVADRGPSEQPSSEQDTAQDLVVTANIPVDELPSSSDVQAIVPQ
ncbi:hypothetical protein Dimus_030561, partial [Dionaea muscipula]